MLMLEVILLGAFLLGGMRILANDGFTDCPDGFDYNDELNLCYKAVFEDLDWDQATTKCDKLAPGGRLAIILTNEQQKAVAKFLRDKIEENCPDGFDYNDELNMCYKALFEDLNFDQAGTKCGKMSPGARLAVILTQEQQNAVAKFLKEKIKEKPEGLRCKPEDDKNGGLHFYIAARSKNLDEPYFWRFPNFLEFPVRYASWNTGAPVKKVTNFCAVINSSMEFNWINVRCNTPRCALCEI